MLRKRVLERPHRIALTNAKIIRENFALNNIDLLLALTMLLSCSEVEFSQYGDKGKLILPSSLLMNDLKYWNRRILNIFLNNVSSTKYSYHIIDDLAGKIHRDIGCDTQYPYNSYVTCLKDVNIFFANSKQVLLSHLIYLMRRDNNNLFALCRFRI